MPIDRNCDTDLICMADINGMKCCTNPSDPPLTTTTHSTSTAPSTSALPETTTTIPETTTTPAYICTFNDDSCTSDRDCQDALATPSCIKDSNNSSCCQPKPPTTPPTTTTPAPTTTQPIRADLCNNEDVSCTSIPKDKKYCDPLFICMADIDGSKCCTDPDAPVLTPTTQSTSTSPTPVASTALVTTITYPVTTTTPPYVCTLNDESCTSDRNCDDSSDRPSCIMDSNNMLCCQPKPPTTPSTTTTPAPTTTQPIREPDCNELDNICTKLTDSSKQCDAGEVCMEDKNKVICCTPSILIDTTTTVVPEIRTTTVPIVTTITVPGVTTTTVPGVTTTAVPGVTTTTVPVVTTTTVSIDTTTSLLTLTTSLSTPSTTAILGRCPSIQTCDLSFQRQCLINSQCNVPGGYVCCNGTDGIACCIIGVTSTTEIVTSTSTPPTTQTQVSTTAATAVSIGCVAFGPCDLSYQRQCIKDSQCNVAGGYSCCNGTNEIACCVTGAVTTLTTMIPTTMTTVTAKSLTFKCDLTYQRQCLHDNNCNTDAGYRCYTGTDAIACCILQ